MATRADDLFADLVPQTAGPIFGPPPKPKEDAPPSGYRWADASHTQLEAIPHGPADKAATDPKAQESERTAAFLATNLGANIGIMNNALKVDPSASKPTWGQWFAGFLGQDIKNQVLPEQRQVVENSQRLIVDAALTLGTGAAYTKEQIEAYRRGFFPQLGDSEAAISAKREALRAALIAARTKAGSQAPQIDAAMQALGMDPNAAPPSAKSDDALALAKGTPPSGGGDGTSPPGTSNLTDEQARAYKAFLATNPNPDGGTLKTFLEGLTGKTVTNADAIAKALKQGGGINTTVQDLSYQEKIKQRIGNEDKLGVGDNPATTLATQGGTLGLSDEAAGIGNAAANILTSPFTGKFDPVFSYQFGRDAERQRIQNAREQLGYGGTAIELASGLGSAGPSALAQFTPKAVGIAGAASGALAGFGYGEGAGESTTGAGAGALGGYALGRFAPAAVERVLPRGMRSGRGLAPEVAEAADRQNVSLIRPMVDENILQKFERLKGTENAGPIIEGGANRTLGDIETAVGGLGQGGNASNREAQGEALRTIAQGIKATDREGSAAAYDAARQLQPDAMVEPATMRQRIDAKLSELALRPNQNRAEIRALQRYRADLDKQLPLQEIRTMRTDAYDNVHGSVSRSAEQKRADRFMMGVIDGANQDVEAALTPEALDAYRAADAQYRENKTLYKQAFKPLFGDAEGDLDKLSAEQIHDRFKRAINTNGQAIASFHRRMPLEQSRDFAATIAEKLGRSAPDAPFDAQMFLNQTKDFSPSALRTMFGPGGEQSIADLRLLSRKLLDTGALKTGVATRAGYLERQSWRQLARSFLGGVTGLLKSGAGVGASGLAGGAGYVGGGVAGATAAAGTAAAIAGTREVSRVLSARSMISPRLAKWLAQAADVSSHKAAQEATRKLGVIIAREPAIAGELQPIYEMLKQRVSQPLAAQPGTEGNNNE